MSAVDSQAQPTALPLLGLREEAQKPSFLKFFTVQQELAQDYT